MANHFGTLHHVTQWKHFALLSLHKRLKNFHAIYCSEQKMTQSNLMNLPMQLSNRGSSRLAKEVYLSTNFFSFEMMHPFYQIVQSLIDKFFSGYQEIKHEQAKIL